MDQINGLDTHTTESDGYFKGCSETVSSFESKDKASMSDSLLALKGLLIGNINNISGPDIGKDELFFSEGFLFFLFFYNGFNVLSGGHLFGHWWD